MTRERKSQEYWDAFEERIERTREIMAGDPDYDETQARMDAHRHASKFATPDTSDSSPLAMRKGGCK